MKPVRDEMNEVKKTDEIRMLLTNRSLHIRDCGQFRFLPPVSNGLKKVIAIRTILLIAGFVMAEPRQSVGGANRNQEPNATVMQKQAAEKANQPLEKTVEIGNEVNMVVVFIPAGEFEMGSPLDEPKRDDDEAQHHIKLTKAFYIGKFEVTQLQYRVIVNDNPSKFRRR